MTTLRIGELASRGSVNLETILLALKVTPNQPCIEVVHQIESKAVEVKAKITHLQAIYGTLRKMKSSCEGRCAVSDCPILESLDSERPS